MSVYQCKCLCKCYKFKEHYITPMHRNHAKTGLHAKGGTQITFKHSLKQKYCYYKHIATSAEKQFNMSKL